MRDIFKGRCSTGFMRDNCGIRPTHRVHALLIIATGLLVYLNTMTVPFIFDDYAYLVNNPAIESIKFFLDTARVSKLSILPDLKNNIILRPLSYFTFALNYYFHGLDLFGYHLVNLLLHVGCALLVYYFFSRLLPTALNEAGRKGDSDKVPVKASRLPLFAALLFVCHPIQTQAVTYIVQRFVPLATLFYLTALVLYLKYRQTTCPSSMVPAYVLSLVSVVLAMESKEIAFTLPVIIAMLEFMFLDGKIVPRVAGLIPFFLTMTIIPSKLLHLQAQTHPEQADIISGALNLINFSGRSSWDYLFTQFGVITTYIRLLFLPVGQNFDYDYPMQTRFAVPEVLFPLMLLLLIAGTGLYFLKRSRENRLYTIIAFGIFWFFITLSVESGIVPIDDLIFEHRVYLPSIGFFMALLTGAEIIFNRLTRKSPVRAGITSALLTAIVLSMSAATIARNMVWQDSVLLCNDVVTKSPNKARCHSFLGKAFMLQTGIDFADYDPRDIKSIIKPSDKDDIENAVEAFQTALRLAPNHPFSYELLAFAYMFAGDFGKAEDLLSTEVRLIPDSSVPHVLLGEIYEAQNDLSRAREEYLEAVELVPLDPIAHKRLAAFYEKEGSTREAIGELETVMQIYPDEELQYELEELRKTYAAQTQ